MHNFENSKFIFSDKRRYRLQRHLVFWGFWGFWFGMVRLLNPRYLKEKGHFPDFFQTMAESFLFLLPHVLVVYPLIYFILPRYFFNGKYIKASLMFLLLLCFTIFVNAALLIYIPWHKVIWISSQIKLLQGSDTMTKWSMAYLSALQGSLTASALAASFKMFKFYYLKNQRNQQLQRENVESQLQLLKAQVHPHFLFNTLNNIYSQTQLESPKGSKMIMGLSDMLRYILYEGQKPLVPLKQELQMIKEYMALEKIRYGNKLDLHIQLPEKTEQVYIAPLLLLPFVENCFKHGTSNILQSPWINLTVGLKDNTLVMKLMNGTARVRQRDPSASGIGIGNVRKRLDLLYKGKYDLQVREEEEVFVVDLRVELDTREYNGTPLQEGPYKKELTYAEE